MTTKYLQPLLLTLAIASGAFSVPAIAPIFGQPGTTFGLNVLLGLSLFISRPSKVPLYMICLSLVMAPHLMSIFFLRFDPLVWMKNLDLISPASLSSPLTYLTPVVGSIISHLILLFPVYLSLGHFLDGIVGHGTRQTIKKERLVSKAKNHPPPILCAATRYILDRFGVAAIALGLFLNLGDATYSIFFPRLAIATIQHFTPCNMFQYLGMAVSLICIFVTNPPGSWSSGFRSLKYMPLIVSIISLFNPPIHCTTGPTITTSPESKIHSRQFSSTGYISVYEEESFRLLRAGHSIIGGTFKTGSPFEPVYSTFYLQGMAAYGLPLNQFKSERLEVLQIGLGIGTVTHQLVSLFNKNHLTYNMTVIELDSEVIIAAENWFGFNYVLKLSDGLLNVITADGLAYLASKPDRSFDLLIYDIFSTSLPPDLFTKSVFETLKSRLKRSKSILVVNYVGRVESAALVWRTLWTVFGLSGANNVRAFAEGGLRDGVGNIVRIRAGVSNLQFSSFSSLIADPFQQLKVFMASTHGVSFSMPRSAPTFDQPSYSDLKRGDNMKPYLGRVYEYVYDEFKSWEIGLDQLGSKEGSVILTGKELSSFQFWDGLDHWGVMNHVCGSWAYY